MHENIETVKKTIKLFCESEPRIAATYIFGSYGKGTQKLSSDIDLALLLDETKAGAFSILQFISTIENKLRCKTDVVIINKASEVLKYEIRRHGLLIFERSSEYRKNFEVKGRKSYEDFLYLHQKYVKTALYGGNNG